jgi:hypothetical protein
MVTGDETWVHHHSLEKKPASMGRKLTGYTRWKQFIMGYLLVNVFRDHKGTLLVDFKESGARINAASYCATLQRLRAAINLFKPTGYVMHQQFNIQQL